MARTVVGLFDSTEEARDVVQELVDNGFSRNDISLVANDARGEYANYRSDGDGDTEAAEGAATGAVSGGVFGGVLGLLVGVGALAIPGIGPVLAAGPLAAALGSAGAGALIGAGTGAAAGGLLGGLLGAGIPEDDAEYFSEGVRRGGTLVVVRAPDDTAQLASDIMNRHNVIDIDQRVEQWRGSGWSRFDANAKPYTTQEIDRFRTTRTTAATGRTDVRKLDREGETVLPVVEEELKVGKREVEGGGVRLRTYVTEQPVEEQVTLRQERVSVERRPVDRPASEADISSFREGTLEVTERSEEAVVSKRARVIEEVVIGKEVRERTETIRDTVRRTDVDVDETTTGRERAIGKTDYSSYDTDFRNHFQTNYADRGYTYDQYSPVYRYGYSLADRYQGREWADVEPEARRYWDERNPNTWEEFKDSVRYAWDRARGAR